MTLKERIEFLLRGWRIIFKETTVFLDNGKKVQFFRCQRDGKLVTDAMHVHDRHLVHHLIHATCLRWHEWLRVGLGRIPI